MNFESGVLLTWLALQQMLGLVSSDMGHGGKDIAAVSGSTLDAVAVVDATLASLMIDIKVAQVVVKVDGSGAEVAAEEGGVGSEDGGDVDMTLAAEGNTYTGKPLMEVSNDGSLLLVGSKLVLIEIESSVHDSVKLVLASCSFSAINHFIFFCIDPQPIPGLF